MRDIDSFYSHWLEKAHEDADVIEELAKMGPGEERTDAFCRDLEFGTAGLRGILGAGTNRMNVHTVARTSQGLADYVNKTFEGKRRSVAISYDSRIKSELFARKAASVFAANGLRVYLFRELMPTPCASFAVRYYGCGAGVMVTASHNPCQYNGYKVYGPDGCQITSAAADAILAEINKLDYFDGIYQTDFDQGVASGAISWVDEDAVSEYIRCVKQQSLLGGEKVNQNASIVYSPLNGTGLNPVLRTLRECGYTNISIVKEQEKPDGRFPTCPYPNPEIREAMALGMETAEREGADLLIATDPDCDRVGIAVKDRKGEFTLLTGNQVGVLLLDYICARRIELGTMPDRPVVVKTIVTTEMARQVAQGYGVETVDVLTGFKYIGETIAALENAGEENRYLFGFEESYGYLSGTYVRDKDAVVASMLICEMFCRYRDKGVSLLDRLEQLYEKYGYCLNKVLSYAFSGSSAAEDMSAVMDRLRGGVETLGGRHVTETLDYAPGVNGLPKANVLKFTLGQDGTVIARPSGTEPKLKFYLSLSAQSKEEAEALALAISDDLNKMIHKGE